MVDTGSRPSVVAGWYRLQTYHKHFKERFSKIFEDQRCNSAGGWDLHLAEACRHSNVINKSDLPVFTGEFSCAITECQKYLQGGYETPYNPGTSDETCK